MRVRPSSLILVLCVCAAVSSEERGTIKGTLVDENGTPVANAQVFLIASSPAIHRVIQVYGTDREGQFVIDNVRFGAYTVFAGKQDLGYPVMPGQFYGVDGFPVVNLKPGLPTVAVTIHLPPTAGAIQSISVIDATTGQKLESAAITLRRVADPDAFIQTSTTVKPILIPSNTEVSIQITASGYKAWPPSKGDPKAAGRMRLEPGQALKMDVKLQPVGSQADSVALFSPGVLTPKPAPATYARSPILAGEVKLFIVTADDISVPLEQLADQYKVPIGFEASPQITGSRNRPPVRIDVEAGTVRDVLNAIVAADPAYTWAESSSGVESIFPKDRPSSLLDVVVTNLSLDSVYRDDAVKALLSSPEVQRWMDQAGVSRREIAGTISKPSSVGPIIYHLKLPDLSVRKILDTILIATGSHYWTYSRYGDRGEFVSVRMED